MKKMKQGGLKLRVETVRQLTGADLRKVAGGVSGNEQCTCGSNKNNETCSTFEDQFCQDRTEGCPGGNSFGVCW
jgi:hypothetical protein